MKRISIRIGIALLAFLFGVFASTIRLRFFVAADESAFSPMSLQDEEWHRLFEAAGMSGDAALRNQVYDRLLCANKAGVPDARPIIIESTTWCKREDETIHPLLLNDTHEYGSFSLSITSSHARWSLKNLDFVRTVSTGQKAKEYIVAHEWFLYQ